MRSRRQICWPTDVQEAKFVAHVYLLSTLLNVLLLNSIYFTKRKPQIELLPKNIKTTEYVHK